MWDVKWYKDALLVNRDVDWTIQALNGDSREEMLENIRQYFLKFTGHKITDFLLNIFEQISFIPSEKMDWIGAKYAMRDEYDETMPYYIVLEKLHKCYVEYGIDPVAEAFDIMKKNGIRPWITFRMNDAHYAAECENSLQKMQIFYEEEKAGHLLGDEYGYFKCGYNFSYPKIREAFLGMFEEVLDKYDMFGLELDFQRDIFCFDYKNDPDCHKIMTEFIRQVKEKITAAEKKHGHKICLMIRTAHSAEDALGFGFDIKTMCDEGLIDAVNPTARWEYTDSGIPVREWKEICGENVALFPGIETLNLEFTRTSSEQSKAYSASFYAQGADGIYFNNHQSGSPNDIKVWNITHDNCTDGRREFTVTKQDICSGKAERYMPLPMSADGTLLLELGKIKADDKVTLIADFEGDTIPILSVCGKEALKPEITAAHIVASEDKNKEDVNMTPHTPLSYDLSGIETESTITLTFGGVGTIHYITIIIESK